MVVVSSTFSAPAEGILLQTPDTKLIINNLEVGTATLYITENNVVWGGGETINGVPSPTIQLLYPTISMHAVQRTPSPALYLVINYELRLLFRQFNKATRGKKINQPWWDEDCERAKQERKAAEKVYGKAMTKENFMKYLEINKNCRRIFRQKKLAAGLPGQSNNQASGGGDAAEGDEDDNEFDGEEAYTQLRFVPQNENDLQAMYNAMSQGQTMNPDPNQSADEEDEHYMDGEDDEGEDEFEDAEESNMNADDPVQLFRQMRLKNGHPPNDPNEGEDEDIGE